MAKLYPPNIEGTIPAFTGATLVVPFSMNQAVGATEISGLVLKVKKVNSNEIILTKQTTSFNAYSDCEAVFSLSPTEQELFCVGQYYRIQLAYIDNSNIVGYFSTVGVIKYTAIPTVKILNLKTNSTNQHIYDYVGVYTQIGDSLEKLYSSRLRLYDSDNQIIVDSGDIVHSVLNDTDITEATENFNISRDLESNKTYYLILTTTSINGLITNSPKYKIIQTVSSSLNFGDIKDFILVAKASQEEGSVQVRVESSTKGVASGYFILSRSEAKEPYEWRTINKIVAKSTLLKDIGIIDYTVEQGKTYIYSLQQYNNYNIYSSRLLSNKVYVDFEDMFLLDGERQLKIRFNPKVSSMKDNILETKTNTIGSKYPFITRNGRVSHKEFSLSGLISYTMDDNRAFMGWKDLGIEQNIFDLVSENISAERTFKLEVMQWLNNGKLKIFKSPTEGNYIVRLMSVSLTPNDTVGRMLHTFNCTAIEMAPFDYDTLLKYNFITFDIPEKLISRWKTINFSEKDKETEKIVYKTGELLQGQYIYSVKVSDMAPGSIIYINNEAFYIGATGSYSATTTSPIYSFRLPDNAQYSGSLIVEYKDVLNTDFDKIRAIDLVENPLRQLIGNSYWQDGSSDSVNIISSLQDAKTEVVSVPKIRFSKRGIHKVYIEYGNISLDSDFYIDGNSISLAYKIDKQQLDKLSLYKIYYSAVGCDISNEKETSKIFYHKNGESFEPYTGYYYDPASDKIIEDSFDLFDININQNWINIEETEEKIVKGIDFNYVSVGDGVITEISYITQILTYSYEYENDSIISLREDYDKAYQEYQSHITDATYNGDLDNELKALKQKYKNLIIALEKAVAADYVAGVV